MPPFHRLRRQRYIRSRGHIKRICVRLRQTSLPDQGFLIECTLVNICDFDRLRTAKVPALIGLPESRRILRQKFPRYRFRPGSTGLKRHKVDFPLIPVPAAFPIFIRCDPGTHVCNAPDTIFPAFHRKFSCKIQRTVIVENRFRII